MADTTIVQGDPAEVTAWSHRTFTQALRSCTGARLMAAGLNPRDQTNFVQWFDELSKGPGSSVVFPLVPNPTGKGVIGDAPMAGQGTPLKPFTDKIYIDQYRKMVQLVGRMSQQRVAYSERNQAKVGLANYHKDALDISLFNQACGNTFQTFAGYTGLNAVSAPDSSHWFFANDKANEANLTSSDTFHPFYIDQFVAMAQGGLPFPIKPVVIKGVEIQGVLFLTQWQVRDLKATFGEGGWGAIYQAAIQGGQITGNPIFTGAIGFRNNVVIHQDTRVVWGDTSQNQVFDPVTQTMQPAPTALGAPATGVMSVNRAVFLGAQAIGYASGAIEGPDGKPLRVTWNEELHDGANQLWIYAGMIGGLKKLRFMNMDYATVVCSTWGQPTQPALPV